MEITKIIDKKSKKQKLSKEEIEYFISGYVKGTITDYHASALLMAIKLNGMNKDETFYLTNAMLNSGKVLDLSNIGFTVDKHSTGGVSDTTTIALVQICASCGVKMLKLSGRGLGFTGGTIDKLESFEGFKTEIAIDKCFELINKNGACMVSASKDLAIADKKLYALRDTTATVESLPLIASSIMSKKLASGADAIVLDVKYGNGAFMKTKSSAIKLAKLMVDIGTKAGKKMDYYIDNMNEPLGYNIGNKLETYEAIEILSGKKGKLYEVTTRLASKCIALAKNISEKEALLEVEKVISENTALEKLKDIVASQGGSLELFDGLNLKPNYKIFAEKDGKLKKINVNKLGEIVGSMGASRQKLTDTVNYDIGLKTFHKLGEKIKKGDLLFEIYAKNRAQALKFSQAIRDCYTF